MKRIILLLALIMGQSLYAGPLPKAVVVLIPGTLNSLILGSIKVQQEKVTDYFSKFVKRSISKQGYEPFVIDDLSPIGELESNGQVVLEKLEEWYKSKYPENNIPIVLLGHSVGGFYALQAASLNKNLPIKKIIALATPLKGSILIDSTLGDQDTDDLDQSLRGLFQISSENITKFLAKIKIPSSIQLFSVAGQQDVAPGVFSLLKSRFINPFLYPFAKIISEKSDGVISVHSARGQGVEILAKDPTKTIGFYDLTDELNLKLDHPEQVLDYKYFYLSGTTNKNYIRDSQLDFYGALINRVFSQ